MAGGPIFPHSAFPVDAGNVFGNFHVGAGSNSKHDEGLGVAASLTTDGTWRLRFQMPPTTLPTGTGKLLLRALANAVVGSALVNPQWASVAGGQDPSQTSLFAEGVSTISFVTTGDVDRYVDTKITLDADTLVAGEEIVMDLLFDAQSGTVTWSLAAVSTWTASIIWE